MAALNRLLRTSFLGSLSRMSTTAAPEGGGRFVPELAVPKMGAGPRRDHRERGVQWVFLGCPGVGKGTYASRLSQLLGVPHIATGDLVREELSSSGSLAQQVDWVLGLMFFVLLEKFWVFVFRFGFWFFGNLNL